ncbi:MAG: UDP-glucose 4-epimerase GalE [Bacillaceae bacterium G1]|nr:MAG: UDP-glucose 4-epimerase GalE [Bacillaceae bacterium G1]
MSILVTGGAGYIGSHAVKELCRQGYEVVVLDDLSTGREALLLDVPFYRGDIADAHLVKRIVQTHHVEALIHFAAKSLVAESMRAPERYFLENTAKSVQLFSALIQEGVRHIVFSSTAAVYGMPDTVPIPESTNCRPVNPYGQSKLMIEQALFWLEQAHGIRWTALRYFNAAGASPDGDLGEWHEPETHLIPLVLQTALGQRDELLIYGNDYDTPDGTCIRDYIHVVDLATAHIAALEGLRKGRLPSGPLNVGTGIGYSVRQVVETAMEVTGRAIPFRYVERRPGDPPVLVAATDKIRTLLDWEPNRSDLRTIIADAWNWHKTINRD